MLMLLLSRASVAARSANAMAASSCKPRSGLHSPPRGGQQDEEEDAELDAYIEQLLAEPPQTDDDNDEPPLSESTPEEEGEEAVEENEDIEQEEGKSFDSDESVVSSSVPVPVVEEEVAVSPKAKPPSSRKKKKRKAKTRTKPVEAAASETAVQTEDPLVEQNSVVPETPIPSLETEGLAADATAASPIEPRRPPPPPNALYRLLLNRANGWGGRATVLVLVMTSEFLHTYVPPLAMAGDWMMARMFPGRGPTSRRRRSVQPPSSSQNVASVTRMGQTGVSRKKRRQFTQQADQQALAQLNKRPASDVRYAFCSQAFCQRHGLGKWARESEQQVDADSNALVVAEDSEMSVIAGQDDEPSVKKRRKKKEVDWVVAALSKEPKHERSPALSLSVGSNGLTISVDIDGSSQRDRVTAALHFPSTRSSKSAVSAPLNTSPRKNDADAGVVGRLRAAAGSSMARSLSGAYPGDALAVEEAASPLGLTDFATKYGYGDWIESDDEEDFGFDDSAVRPKKRKRRRKGRPTGEEDNLLGDMDWSFPTMESSERPRYQAHRAKRPDIALSSSPTLSQNRKRPSQSTSRSKRAESTLSGRTDDWLSSAEKSRASTVRRVQPRRVDMARPPLERIKKVKKRKDDEP
jgi:hypothetical protein